MQTAILRSNKREEKREKKINDKYKAIIPLKDMAKIHRKLEQYYYNKTNPYKCFRDITLCQTLFSPSKLILNMTTDNYHYVLCSYTNKLLVGWFNNVNPC